MKQTSSKIVQKICFFSANRYQRHYFTQLAQYLPQQVNTEQWWYKSLPSDSGATIDDASTSVQPIVAQWVRRKEYTASAKNKGAWWWTLSKTWQSIYARYLLRKYAGILAKQNPSHVAVWNGKKFRQALFVLAAKQLHIPVLFFEKGPVPGYSMVDPVGVDALSSIPKNIEFYQQNRQPFTNAPRHTPIKRVFVPFQVLEDSNIYLHSPWVRDMRHLFALIQQAAQDYPQIEFVCKQHPVCPENYEDLHQQAHANVSFANQTPSQELIATSDVVITINSTVGTEALMQDKTVIVLGEALYGFNPLTYTVNSDEAFMTAFHDVVQGWQPPVGLTHAFIQYLKDDYAVIGDAMEDVVLPTHYEAMSQKVMSLL